MNKLEILIKIEKLETEQFYLNMQDRMSSKDHMRYIKLIHEIHDLKNQLQELEK